jgi:hypothetical protein
MYEREIGSGFWCEKIWVEIFFKTQRAWTFFTEYLQLTFALFFFIFYFEFPNQMLLFNRMITEGMSVDLEDSRLRKGCKILRDGWKNQIKKWKCFSSGTEILHSFLSDLIFEDAWLSYEIGFLYLFGKLLWKWEAS